MADAIEKYYKMDDSENPGWAKVKILKKCGKGFFSDNLYQVQIIEIIKPSTFVKRKIGTRFKVTEKLLFDVIN